MQSAIHVPVNRLDDGVHPPRTPGNRLENLLLTLQPVGDVPRDDLLGLFDFRSVPGIEAVQVEVLQTPQRPQIAGHVLDHHR